MEYCAFFCRLDYYITGKSHCQAFFRDFSLFVVSFRFFLSAEIKFSDFVKNYRKTEEYREWNVTDDGRVRCAGKALDKPAGSGIIKNITDGLAEKEVHFIGKIDVEKYQLITRSKILTDQVVLTSNREEHIIERRGKEFYEKYVPFFADIISDPDYIFKDQHENTVLVSKKFKISGEWVNIVLRLVVEGENPDYKNSIITAVLEGEKRFSQRLRNNIPIFIRLDKKE